ncbi:MAG: SUMF1/EgtB/PvdO family nonheme iron enzyme [Chloroflexi bacterium]|nr:SUMF1/EgtB/PvdO family nonheme iron enzyme [Chloroflexota bacterium]
MKRLLLIAALVAALLAGCAAVDLNAPIPTFDTGVEPTAWAKIPAGEFLSGQEAEPIKIDYDYEMMITDVTLSQYTAYLTEALAKGGVKVDEFNEKKVLVGFYPGDEFHGVKHEEKIEAGDWIIIPLDDPASRFTFDGVKFTAKPGYESHPMTNVTWFGSWAYCGSIGGRLPTELEWEKAARGTDGRALPWGEEMALNRANFYASRDPFENMGSFGSRTSPVGFYNGKTYGDYATLSNASPYGLYDMAGNVWQWTGNVYEGMHYRFMRGGSKDTYDMDLRTWVRNNATPTYFSPGVGFRCAK